MKRLYSYFLSAALSALAVCSCNKDIPTSEAALTDSDIHIGGVVTPNGLSAEAVTTKADAVDVLDWLAGPLSGGWNIKYWWTKQQAATTNVAVLTLEMNGSEIKRDGNGLPIYSFKYKDSGINAQWYGNGGHVFQATYAPGRLITNVPTDITSDQHDDSAVSGSEGNYTLLERYLAMPADTSLIATTTRIGLPFTRRLSRVIFYILIDPNLIDPATSQRPTLKGYQLIGGKDDPTTTALRFKNVMVLDYAKQQPDGTLSPVWTTADEVIPHSIGEKGSIGRNGEVLDANDCILYYHKHKEYYITPCGKEWETARAAYDLDPTGCGYDKLSYGKVPCYDMIIRPTYTDEKKVMYDEEGSPATIADLVNSFVTDIELSNGLAMVSNVKVDLDADFQVSIFIRLNLEEVDFNTATIEKWVENKSSDKYYGVDSEYDHNLSYAGSTWQRAYRIGSVSGDVVSDNHKYNEDGEYGQYLAQATWIEKLQQACKDSVCHGDYFILESDITINTDDFPADFVFTGHLDAMGHKITLSGSRSYLFYGINGVYETAQENDITAIWEANVHLEKALWVPVKGYRAEVLNLVLDGGDLASSAALVSGYVKNCRMDDGSKIEYANPGIPEY